MVVVLFITLWSIFTLLSISIVAYTSWFNKNLERNGICTILGYIAGCVSGVHILTSMGF